MSIPAEKAATSETELKNVAENENTKATETEETYKESDDSEAEVKKFEAKVSDIVKQIKRGTDGKYILPADLSPELKVAAIAEQRRRDTQSEFTRTSQQKKAIEAENKALKSKAIKEVKLELTAEQAEELEDLKFSDPEAWRKKVNKLEIEARDKQQKELDDEVGKISADTLAEEEKERRKDIVKAFNKEHNIKIDDDLIQNDIPPRIIKRLETGQISFETFLQEVLDYTKTGKVVKQDELKTQPNLSRIGGGSSPDKTAEKEDIITSYNKEVY